MCPTLEDIRPTRREQGGELPRRSMDATKITMAGELDTGWIKKEFLGLLNFSWDADYAGITAQVWGRYVEEDGTPIVQHRIGDTAGDPITIDLAKGADGSSFPIDLAAPVDELRVLFSANVTGVFVLGKAA